MGRTFPHGYKHPAQGTVVRPGWFILRAGEWHPVVPAEVGFAVGTPWMWARPHTPWSQAQHPPHQASLGVWSLWVDHLTRTGLGPRSDRLWRARRAWEAGMNLADWIRADGAWRSKQKEQE